MLQHFYNKKGIESLSFSLIAVSIISFALISTIFFEMNFFSEFKDEYIIKKDIQNLKKTIELLKKTSDIGSFSKAELRVPDKYSVELNSITNNITIKKDNIKIEEIQISADIIETINFEPAIYDITLFFGSPTQKKEKTIYFL